MADGFPGQIFHSIPHALIAHDHPLMQPLHITDIGWYPHARHHFRERPEGADENILLVCMDGEGWAEIRGRRFTLSQGQALLIPRGVPHAYAAAVRRPWSIHWAHSRGDAASYYLRLLPDGDYRIPLAPGCLKEIEALFRSAYRVLAESYSPSSLLYLAQLAHPLLGLIFYHNDAYSPVLRAPASHDVQATVTFASEHYTESLTRGGLARHAGLSVAQFSLLFQRQTGLSPIRFLIHRRMRRACQYLDTTSLTVREVAMKVGYDDPYYFSRLFSRVMGCSPRQYRRICKG